MADPTTGISQTGIINILNKTPIEWYFKLQYCAETDIYDIEYDAARIYADHIFDLRNTQRYPGFPLQMVNGLDAL